MLNIKAIRPESQIAGEYEKHLVIREYSFSESKCESKCEYTQQGICHVLHMVICSGECLLMSKLR